MFAFERGFKDRKYSVLVLAGGCDYMPYMDVLVFLNGNAIDKTNKS